MDFAAYGYWHTRTPVAAGIVAARRDINTGSFWGGASPVVPTSRRVPPSPAVAARRDESSPASIVVPVNSEAPASSLAGPSLALILDVDDTMLKEVPITARSHESVQLLRYMPAPHVAARYREQLASTQPLPPHKVVHYEFDGERMTSAVVLRPGIERLILRLRAAGCVLLLASVNDGARTAAVCTQLRLRSGGTLAELGCRAVPREFVSPTGQGKDISSIRAWAGLDELCLAVIIDDQPDALSHASLSDHIVRAPPFDRAASDVLLALPAAAVGAMEAAIEPMEADALSAAHTLPHLGVSIAFLDAFLAGCMPGLDRSSATTSEVCEHIMKRVWLSDEPTSADAGSGGPTDCIKDSGLSFANLVQAGRVPGIDASMVGPATHFTSHAWAYRFADLVDALKGDVGASDATGATCYFWLDLFVVPQRAPVTPPQAWWATSFFRAIAAQRYFVLVAHTWDAPLCVTRCWCLWEVYAALRMGKSVRDGSLLVATSAAQRKAFRAQLLADVHGVQKAVVRVSAARAQAWNLEDRAMIFGAIRKHSFDGVTGFDGIDAVIKRLLQGWVAVTGRAICDQEVPVGPAGRAQHAALRHAVGLIAHQHADYVTAEGQLRLALEDIRMAGARIDPPRKGGASRGDDQHGGDGAPPAEEDEGTHKTCPDPLALLHQAFEIMHRLALTLRKTPTPAHESEASQLLGAIAADCRASAEQRLRAQKMLGELMIERGDDLSVAAGVAALRECLEMLSAPFSGSKRADALLSRDGALRQLLHCEKILGTGLRAQGLLDEAVELHRRTAQEWADLDGESHDNALSATHELALTLGAAGGGHEATRLLERVVAARVREDGAGHRKTLAAVRHLEEMREMTATQCAH